MLIDFTFSNYKSFLETTTFSMSPAPKQRTLSYSLLSERCNKKTIKATSTAVIYGPNAAGKTTIISAIDTLKQIVSRGNINDTDVINSNNMAAFHLSLIPNSGLKEPRETQFNIRFVNNGALFSYSLHINLGAFMNEVPNREIVFESLHANGEEIFERNHKSLKVTEKYYVDKDSAKNQVLFTAAESSLNETELFLCNGFKTIVNQNLAVSVISWFQQKLMVYCGFNNVHIAVNADAFGEKDTIVDESTNKIAKAFGSDASSIGFQKSKIDGNKQAQLVSIVKNGESTISIPADYYESFGTVRFLTVFPGVTHVLKMGGTFIADEFDDAIHPMAIMSILNLFHNDEMNKNHAQLVFNTHNPLFLNRNILRRDEIHFVERSHETHESELYRLSDFGTGKGSAGRSVNDYMKNYFRNKYGAIETVDFTDAIKEIMDEKVV